MNDIELERLTRIENTVFRLDSRVCALDERVSGLHRAVASVLDRRGAVALERLTSNQWDGVLIDAGDEDGPERVEDDAVGYVMGSAEHVYTSDEKGFTISLGPKELLATRADVEESEARILTRIDAMVESGRIGREYFDTRMDAVLARIDAWGAVNEFRSSWGLKSSDQDAPAVRERYIAALTVLGREGGA